MTDCQIRKSGDDDMGAYAGLIGDTKIDKEKKKEFSERVRRIFRVGGMAKCESISIEAGNREIYVLVSPDQADGNFGVNYNYLEDDWWESISFNEENTYFSSGKIGGRQYAWTYIAALMLTEQYTKGSCITRTDGVYVPIKESLGWLNGLFHETYTLESRRDAGRILQILKDYSRWMGDTEEIGWDEVQEYLPTDSSDLVEPITTSDYLEVDDDDLIYCWEPNDLDSFSNELKAIFEKWKEQYETILHSEDFAVITGEEFAHQLMEDLYLADQTYCRIMVWRDMFFDYMIHAEHKAYQVSWVLFQELTNELSNDKEMIELRKLAKIKKWEFIQDDLKENSARIQIKRYLSLLYNRALRKRILGF